MVTIGTGHKLNVLAAVSVARGGVKVALDVSARAILSTRRKQVVDFITRTQDPAYGFNRGFGHNVDVAVPPDKLALLQKNLIRSHASGVGDAAPVDVIRLTMLLRAHSLAQGHSGVRPEVIESLIDFLNHGITPVVPRFGSVGASGDLAPLSHIALALIGEGEVFCEGVRLSAVEALKKVGLSPLELQMKEGLALNNGVQFSTAWGIINLIECENLLKTAAISTALSTQVFLGSDTPFAAELHALRPHPGAEAMAKIISGLMVGSPLREAHRLTADDPRVP